MAKRKKYDAITTALNSKWQAKKYAQTIQEKYPDFESVTIEWQRGYGWNPTGEIHSHTWQANPGTHSYPQKAFFDISCRDGCTGYYDLSSEVYRMNKDGLDSAEGTMSCKGHWWPEDYRCDQGIKYTITIKKHGGRGV